MKRTTVLVLVLVLGLALAVSTALADEGRIPIFEPIDLDIANMPISGKYVVTANIVAASGNVIRVRGSGTEEVEIDLNGFTLTAEAGADSVIDAKDIRTLTIVNGVIHHLGSSGSSIKVEDTDRAIINENKVSGGRYGIRIGFGVSSFAILRNTITTTADNCILVNYTSNPDAEEVAEGAIEDNTLRDCGSPSTAPDGARGIEVRFGVSSVAIKRNRIERPYTYGMTVNSRGTVIIEGNRVNSTGYRGIIASRTGSCRISDNVVQYSGVLQDSGRGGDGLFVNDSASNCLILNNVSTNNWMSGLRVEGDRSHIDRNVLNDNTLAGLHFEPEAQGNTFGRNTVRNKAVGNTFATWDPSPGLPPLLRGVGSPLRQSTALLHTR